MRKASLITNEQDLKDAAMCITDYIQEKAVTLSVTVDELYSKTEEQGVLEVTKKEGKMLELAKGIEPPTCGLQNRCSAD